MLISMHMEKCGGTSMKVLLRQQYGAAFQLYDPGYPQAPLAFTPGAGVSCLHGHMYYGLHRQFPGIECNYITLLRDPLSRFLSNYQHIRSYQHPLHDLVNSNNGLQEFCKHKSARHYRNLFVRRLSAIDTEPGEVDLDRAECRLRQFALVGQVEYFEAFVKAAIQRFNWSEVLIPHENAAINDAIDKQISAVDLELVKKVNALDLELMKRVEDILIV